MKKQIIILIFALTGVTAMHTAQAQAYDHLAVQRINDLIANNGLQATPDSPATWEFAIWNDETFKKIVGLQLRASSANERMVGDASFAGLTTLQTLNLDGNQLTKIDVTNCTQLQTLSCMDNCKISEIDLTGCIELQSLMCAGNSLLNLDLANLDKLTEFAGYGQNNIIIDLYSNYYDVEYWGDIGRWRALNNLVFTNSAISCHSYYSDYWEEYYYYVLCTDNTVRFTDFSVQTNKEGFELTGNMMLRYTPILILTGIDSQESMQLKIYPNPTAGELRIESGELRITSVEIFDVNGKKMKSEIEKSNILIDISHLPAGIYVVKVMTEQGGMTQKIMKR